MDAYIIPPLSNLELMEEGSRYFCLAQLYKKHDFYRNFFKQKVANKEWVTLDNGAGDHDIVTAHDLFAIMADLKPSEIIPLDFIGDGVKTIMYLEDFTNSMRDAGHLKDIRVLGVPQGKTKEDWLFVYNYMLQYPYVGTIGMSKIGIPKVFTTSTSKGRVVGADEYIKEGRHECFYHLLNNGLLKKPLHFLGMGSPDEFDWYFELMKRLPELKSILRSTDSCNTIWSAMNGKIFERNDFDRVPTPKDYFERKMTEEDVLRAKLNISWFKKKLVEKVALND